MEWANPIEWLSWVYGKLFQNHVWFGGTVVVGLFAVLGLVLWVRAVDKYREEHSEVPKPQAVVTTIQNSQSATASASQTQTQTQKKHIQRPSRKPDALAASPRGIVGIAGSSNATVEMGGNSQIAGYETGIQGEDHLHVVMKDQSRIDSNPNASPPSADKQSSPSGPGLRNLTIMIPPTDLPLNPVAVGTSSTSSTKDQMDAINALVRDWRDSHPNWTVIGRNAIRWMNQTLEEQGKDFRIKIPEHCNPPLPGIAGVAVPPGGTRTLNGAEINGAAVGMTAGQNSKAEMNDTEVVVSDNCD
jgi:hypothetical protein